MMAIPWIRKSDELDTPVRIGCVIVYVSHIPASTVEKLDAVMDATRMFTRRFRL